MYLAYEFSQAKIGEPITDDQVDMFVHWYNAEVLVEYPNMPKIFPCHSELAAGIADGKSDAARRGVEAEDLRERILRRLAA